MARLWRAAVALQGLTSAVVLSAKRYVCLAAYLVVIRSVLPLRFGVEELRHLTAALHRHHHAPQKVCEARH